MRKHFKTKLYTSCGKFDSYLSESPKLAAMSFTTDVKKMSYCTSRNMLKIKSDKYNIGVNQAKRLNKQYN